MLGKLGDYELIRELGRGGMGVVYEGRDPARPDARLALKLILAHGAGPEELARFRREAEALARFRHPNVVTVNNLVFTPRGPVLVTALVEGEDLAARRKRGPLPPRACAELLRELADAVQALHAEGIIHRDLKPQNVMLTPEGSPILLDFGLVRQRGAQSLTQTGALLGTPAYMSPEQAGGEAKVDELSDVYALGAILYFLLAGESPYTGGALAVLKQVIDGTPPPAPSTRATDAEPDRALEAICLRAMAAQPERRYPSAGHLRDALDAYLAPRADPRVLRRWVGVGVLALLLAALALVLLRGPASGLPEDPAALAPLLEQAPDPAQLGQEWQAAYPEHPGRAQVASWVDGYTQLARLLVSSTPDARLAPAPLRAWLAQHPDHPARARAADVLAGSEALDALLPTLVPVKPSEARARLVTWRGEHPGHPDTLDGEAGEAWLSRQLEGCDAAVRVGHKPTPTGLSAWVARYPELPVLWLDRPYIRVGLQEDLWEHATTVKTSRAQFLPGRPLRFVTWGFESWASHERLQLWELHPKQDPPVTLAGTLALEGGAVLDVAISPKGELSLLLGLWREHPGSEPAPGNPWARHEARDYDSGLVAHLPLEALDGQPRAAEALIDGEPFGDWRRWLARTDADGRPRFVVAGNRNQREGGREVERTEGVWRFVPGDGVDHRTTEPVRGVAFSDDGTLLAVNEGSFGPASTQAGLAGQAVSLFDAHTGAELLRNPHFAALPSRVAFLPGTRTLVVTTHAHGVHLHDAQGGWRRLEGAETQSLWGGQLPSHNGIARAAVVDPSGRYLLTVSGMAEDDGDRKFMRGPNELRVWDLRAPQAPDLEDYRLTGLRHGLFDASLAPGGHWLVLTTWRRVVLRQWLAPSE